MEKANKRKAKAVAIAAAAVLALAGTIAYLADASGIIRNQWDPNHVEVDIAETDVAKDDGTKDYSITPGATDPKDPKITVDTDTDAYVFAAVKDNINNAVSGTTYVEYEIADGWILLDKTDLQSKTIQKYLKTFADHKTAGSVTINPNDANTKIYYRVVHGTNDSQIHGPFSVLKNDQVHYPSTLTNADLDKLTTLGEDQKQLIFSTYAIQMDPFCDPAETAETKIEAGAKDAWNQVDKVSKITVTAAGGATEVKTGETLQMSAAVLPENAKDKTYTWSVENGTGTATIDQNGLLTGGTAGTVTVVATAKDGSGVKGTYEVTVTGPTYGYAVQFYGYEDGKVVFWPAMGPKAQGAITQGVSHNDDAAGCIHHDSWADIKTNLTNDPNYYDACKTNGCTKKVLLDETKAETDFGMTATAGDGGGIVTYAPWGEPGTSGPGTQTPTYGAVLTQIAGAMIDGPSNPSMFLLSYEMLGSPTPFQPDDSRIVYDQEGQVCEGVMWWLSDPCTYGEIGDSAYHVYDNGQVYDNDGDGALVEYDLGIAPGFRY